MSTNPFEPPKEVKSGDTVVTTLAGPWLSGPFIQTTPELE